jgi:hypothetical protein
MNKEQHQMKRITLVGAAVLLVAGFAFAGAGCKSDGDKADTATTMPDDATTMPGAKSDHPKGDHPSGDHPSGDHPSGDHPKK